METSLSRREGTETGFQQEHSAVRWAGWVGRVVCVMVDDKCIKVLGRRPEKNRPLERLRLG
jgi:hypothetical protein